MMKSSVPVVPVFKKPKTNYVLIYKTSLWGLVDVLSERKEGKFEYRLYKILDKDSREFVHTVFTAEELVKFKGVSLIATLIGDNNAEDFLDRKIIKFNLSDWALPITAIDLIKYTTFIPDHVVKYLKFLSKDHFKMAVMLGHPEYFYGDILETPYMKKLKEDLIFSRRNRGLFAAIPNDIEALLKLGFGRALPHIPLQASQPVLQSPQLSENKNCVN